MNTKSRPPLLLVALACCAPAVASSIPLRWDPVADAERYELCWSPQEFVSIPSTGPVTLAVCKDVGAVTEYRLDGLPANGTIWVAARACNTHGCGPSSAVLAGWPTPEVTAFNVGTPTRVAGTTIPTWRQSVEILGANFKSPGQAVLIDYAGLRLVSYTRASAGRIDVVLEYDRATPAGTVEVWIVNQDGSTCQYTPAAKYAGCVVALAGELEIRPVLVPDQVRGLDWWLTGPRP